MEEHVILGRKWCYLTNCQIDWHKKQAKMVYKGNAVLIPLLQEDTPTQPTMPTSGDLTSDKGKGKQVLIPSTAPSKPPQSPHSTPTTSTHTTSSKEYALFTQHDNISSDKVDFQELAPSSRILPRRKGCMDTTATSSSEASISLAT